MFDDKRDVVVMRFSPCFAQDEDYRAIRHSERQNGTILHLAGEGALLEGSSGSEGRPRTAIKHPGQEHGLGVAGECGSRES